MRYTRPETQDSLLCCATTYLRRRFVSHVATIVKVQLAAQPPHTTSRRCLGTPLTAPLSPLGRKIEGGWTTARHTVLLVAGIPSLQQLHPHRVNELRIHFHHGHHAGYHRRHHVSCLHWSPCTGPGNGWSNAGKQPRKVLGISFRSKCECAVYRLVEVSLKDMTVPPT